MRSRKENRHPRVLITGGASFIGSALLCQLVDENMAIIINGDFLAYDRKLGSLGRAGSRKGHAFEHVDMTDQTALNCAFRHHQPNATMHLIGEPHVHRSDHAPGAFIETNVIGTRNLWEIAQTYWSGLEAKGKPWVSCHHVSTGEVHGDLEPHDLPFIEETAYALSSPCPASKAARCHLRRACEEA